MYYASRRGRLLPPLPREEGRYWNTWNVMLLPFLEQQNLYDNTNKDLPIWGQPIRSTPVSFLRCPSDAGRWEVSETSDIAVTNYPGSEGYHWHPTATFNGNSAPWNSWGDPFEKRFDANGLFTQTRTNRMSAVTDGTSNTLFCAEADSMGFGGGPIRTCGTGARRTGTPVFHSAFVGTALAGWGGNERRQNTVNPDGSSRAGVSWFRNHAFTPTFIAAWGPNASYHGPSSYHSGNGVQVGMIDGSVSFISETIDYGTWLKMNAIGDAHKMIDPRN